MAGEIVKEEVSSNVYDTFLDAYFASAYDNETLSDAYSSEATALRASEQFYSGTAGIGKIRQMRQDVSKYLHSASTPWITNGINIFGGYLFGSNISYVNADKEIETARSHPKNKNFLRDDWYATFIEELLCAGNVFLVRKKSTNHYFILDIDEIDDIKVDSDDKGFITHILRTPDTTNIITPIMPNTPKSYYIARAGIDDKIPQTNGARINPDYEFWHFSTRKKPNEPLAEPILAKTVLFCRIASRYLLDISKFKHSVTLFAAKVKAQTKESASNALEVIGKTESAGNVAGMTDATLSAMSANGLNIANSGSVEFLAAAAASLSVPVSAFSMAAPGSMTSSNASLTTLGAPVRNFFTTQRRILKAFIEEILGGNAQVIFGGMTNDDDTEKIKQSFIAFEKGIISYRDYRDILNRTYELGLIDEMPEFEDTFTAKTMKYQSELTQEQSQGIEQNPDDPTNEGGASGGNTKREDQGQTGRGKRNAQSESADE